MKKNIAVFFGGQSSEHAVSCMSVQNVASHIDKNRYDISLIGITEEGHWLWVPSLEDVADDTWRQTGLPAMLSPDAGAKSLYIKKESGWEALKVDVAFPVLHGLYGEDGTIQGLFELAKIPYVGCGVLASAVSMDKLYTKMIVEPLGIRQAAYVPVMKRELEDMDRVIEKVEAKLSYPVFIKPSCAGSSRGVSKAADRKELIQGLLEAAENDRKILVEETIVGREVECAVLEDGMEIKASGVGEVLAAAEFYDYEAKYHNAESRTDVAPSFPEGIEEEIRRDAVRIFRGVDGAGLARVDFFLTEDGVVFNELNTLPGFTAISMYPMLWEHKGINKDELIEKLIQSAFSREARGKY